MYDPRIKKLASLIVNYSLEIKPDQQLVILSGVLAEELYLEVYAQAILAGAHVFVWVEQLQALEFFLKNASDAQLEYISPIHRAIHQEYDAQLWIDASANTRSLTNIDPGKQMRRSKAFADLNQVWYERSSRKELRWCSTLFPTHAFAQEADMSLQEYRDFVFSAGRLDEEDPVAFWQAESRRLHEVKAWLNGHQQVTIKGADIDLRFSIKDREFVVADGKYNFPDGEIFTGPIENSLNGWVRFDYPLLCANREIEGVELWFEEGKIVKETAKKGQDFLTELLNTDQGSRYIGEWGIGMNYHIPHFSKNMLFDEKLGGTIHLAAGNSYPETKGENKSVIHVDLLCNMADGEVVIDNDIFYRNGKVVV